MFLITLLFLSLVNIKLYVFSKNTAKTVVPSIFVTKSTTNTIIMLLLEITLYRLYMSDDITP